MQDQTKTELIFFVGGAEGAGKTSLIQFFEGSLMTPPSFWEYKYHQGESLVGKLKPFREISLSDYYRQEVPEFSKNYKPFEEDTLKLEKELRTQLFEKMPYQKSFTQNSITIVDGHYGYLIPTNDGMEYVPIIDEVEAQHIDVFVVVESSGDELYARRKGEQAYFEKFDITPEDLAIENQEEIKRAEILSKQFNKLLIKIVNRDENNAYTEVGHIDR